jgi:AcrR family transcriptional regulator
MTAPPRRRRPYTPRLPPEARREQLLDAAIAVIAREGYGGISIDAIAREANVTRPVVYGVFDGLGPLLYALLDRQEQRALSQLLDALPTNLGLENPDAYLIAAIRRLVDVVTTDPLTWRPVLLTADGMPAEVRQRIESDREVVRERIEFLLQAGLQLRGGPEIDTELASHALIAVAEYFGRMLIERPEAIDADRLVGGVQALLASFSEPQK